MVSLGADITRFTPHVWEYGVRAPGLYSWYSKWPKAAAMYIPVRFEYFHVLQGLKQILSIYLEPWGKLASLASHKLAFLGGVEIEPRPTVPRPGFKYRTVSMAPQPYLENAP